MPHASTPTVGSGPATTSIICTVRNEVRYVEVALRSALATDALDVLVVDDRSTDGTADVLRRLAVENPRLRLVQVGVAGRGPALAAAFDASTAPYVMNLDADDVVHPAWVRLGAALLDAHPDLVALAASPHYLDADATITWSAAPDPMTPHDVTRDLVIFNPLMHSGAILRRRALASAGGYDPALRTHLDYDLWIRLAAAGGRLARVDARLVCKRLHAGQKFERHGRLPYLWASARVQARAIRVLGAGGWAWGILAGRWAWGLLPRRVRMEVRRQFSRR